MGILYAQEQASLNRALNEKQQKLVAISAYTAQSDLPNLRRALNEGLDSGLAVNEIKEVLIHLYAYIGFPRSLNGLSAFQSVLEEREQAGIVDEVGMEASPLPADKTSEEIGSEVLGQLRRDGLNGVLKPSMRERLIEVGRQRTREANGEPVRYVDYVANTEQEARQFDSRMYQQGYEYYRVSHRHPNSQNKYALTSLDKLMAFTALDHGEMISPRPLLVIDGSEAESFYFSQEAYDKAEEPKELFSVAGASHMDLYCKQEFVEQVVEKLDGFFESQLETSEKLMGPDEESPGIQVIRRDLQTSRSGSAEHFTGAVSIESFFRASDPSRVYGASVTFDPGARTAWHSHPLGQVLIVTAGSGLVQRWGDPVEEILPGDVVLIPPDQKHWHGAAPEAAMTHFAIAERVEGRSTEWIEKVSDEEYAGLE